MTTVDVRLPGPHEGPTSFAHLNRAIGASMRSAGLRVGTGSGRARVLVHVGTPETIPAPSQDHAVRVGVLFWESDRVPTTAVEACHTLDLLVVPSAWCWAAFERSGVETPMLRVPLGLEDCFIPATDRPEPDPFELLTTFHESSGVERKGLAELLEAFTAAFGPDGVAVGSDGAPVRVRLVVRTQPCPQVDALWDWFRPGPSVTLEPLVDEGIEAYARRLGRAHAVVVPSRGEGFGLVALQALATATPVVAPSHTGLADILDPTNAEIVRSGGMAAGPDGGAWFHLDVEHLTEVLARLPARWPEVAGKAARAGRTVRATARWDQVLEPLVTVVAASAGSGRLRLDVAPTAARRTPPTSTPADGTAETPAEHATPALSLSVSAPVPTRLYQTWKTRDIPDTHRAWVESVRQCHPGWHYELLSDEDNDAFVATHYPRLLPRFRSYRHAVQRADVIRLLVVHHHGGLYLDLDMETLRPLDGYLAPGRLTLSREAGPRIVDWTVSNALIAAPARHPFLASLIEDLVLQARPDVTHGEQLASTGPARVHDLVARWPRPEQLGMLGLEVVCPVGVLGQNVRLRSRDLAGARADRQLAAIHHNTETWNVQHPPPPQAPDGFDLYLDQDLCGDDRDYLEVPVGDVDALAEACRADPDAIGFNFNGFVKGPGGRLAPLEPETRWLHEGCRAWVCVRSGWRPPSASGAEGPPAE